MAAELHTCKLVVVAPGFAYCPECEACLVYEVSDAE